MSDCEPHIAQTYVPVVVEAAGPVTLPFFLASSTQVRPGPVGASSASTQMVVLIAASAG
jgi:hypothetical protein